MVIKLFDQNTFEKLKEYVRKHYKPQEATVEELAENLRDCYSIDLEDANMLHFKIEGDLFADILEYVKFSGGLGRFDFVI